MFLARITDSPVAAVGLLVLVTVAIVLLLRHLVRPYLKWRLVRISGDLTTDHHLPDEIPVPRREATRVSRGEYTFDEAVGWIEAFLGERRMHPRAREYQAVIKKAEIYREMAKKMGRGLWRDVDRLGARLSEIDPLDPSAWVARGRAMRELGNFAGAIRQYQKALELNPFHSAAFPELAATCRAIGQPGRFRPALQRAREELGETHPLTIEGRIQLGELVQVYADPMDPATLAHIPREQYIENAQSRLDALSLDPDACLEIGQSFLADDMPELAESLVHRCEGEYGACAQALLLKGMLERYHFNFAAAERNVRKSLEKEDMAEAHLELARILLLDSTRALEDGEVPQELVEEAQQHLRLAIDRDPNLFESIKLLMEPYWEEGVDAVAEAIRPIIKTYPHAWGPWRVLGDAYAVSGQYEQALKCYRRGLKIAEVDQLIYPTMEVISEAGMDQDLVQFAQRIRHLEDRDPQVRWRVAQILFEAQKLRKSRRILQNLVDDDRVPPPLRQRANEILDHMDAIERKRAKARQKPKDPEK